MYTKRKQFKAGDILASQSDIAYQQIKDMIFHMEFLPGERIPETQLSSRLSISRTPIRDALRKLESEGLISIGLNRGATVAAFSDDEIKEIGSIRLAQDILSAQLASYYGCASDFEHLMLLADECAKITAQGDVYGRIQSDCNFHLEIARIAGNGRLLAQQRAIYQQIHLIQISKYTDIEQGLLQIHHHKPLISAIQRGDQSQLRILICEHMKDFYRIDPYLIRCYM